MINLLQCSIGIAEQSFALRSKKYQVLKEFNLFNKNLVILRLVEEDLVSQKKSADNIEANVLQSSKTMFCCSTSGTTGKPKVVEVPFKCLMPNVSSLR